MYCWYEKKKKKKYIRLVMLGEMSQKKQRVWSPNRNLAGTNIANACVRYERLFVAREEQSRVPYPWQKAPLVIIITTRWIAVWYSNYAVWSHKKMQYSQALTTYWYPEIIANSKYAMHIQWCRLHMWFVALVQRVQCIYLSIHVAFLVPVRLCLLTLNKKLKQTLSIFIYVN